jgi:hypothetical protein
LEHWDASSEQRNWPLPSSDIPFFPLAAGLVLGRVKTDNMLNQDTGSELLRAYSNDFEQFGSLSFEDRHLCGPGQCLETRLEAVSTALMEARSSPSVG